MMNHVAISPAFCRTDLIADRHEAATRFVEEAPAAQRQVDSEMCQHRQKSRGDVAPEVEVTPIRHAESFAIWL